MSLFGHFKRHGCNTSQPNISNKNSKNSGNKALYIRIKSRITARKFIYIAILEATHISSQRFARLAELSHASYNTLLGDKTLNWYE